MADPATVAPRTQWLHNAHVDAFLCKCVIEQACCTFPPSGILKFMRWPSYISLSDNSKSKPKRRDAAKGILEMKTIYFAILPRGADDYFLFAHADDVHFDVFCCLLDRTPAPHQRVGSRMVWGSNRSSRRKYIYHLTTIKCFWWEPIMFADLLYNVSGGNADYVCRSTIKCLWWECRWCLLIYYIMSLVGMPIMFADLLDNVSGGNAILCLPIYDKMSLAGMPIMFADLIYVECFWWECRLCLLIYYIMSLVGAPIMLADLLYTIVSGGSADTVCRSTIKCLWRECLLCLLFFKEKEIKISCYFKSHIRNLSL